MAKASLEINKLILPVYIGVTSEERKEKQQVEINIKIDFITIPLGCESDKIKDTFCYENIVNIIRTLCNDQEFHLIEHLGSIIHKTIKSNLPSCELTVKLCKKPKIENLEGNCCFTIYYTNSSL